MAGKKGMRHARPRNEAERDMHALIKIEQLIDKLMTNGALKCAECRTEIPWKDVPPHALQMLMKRYDKLKATKTETTVTHKQGWTEAVTKVSQADQQVTPTPSEDRPAVH